MASFTIAGPTIPRPSPSLVSDMAYRECRKVRSHKTRKEAIAAGLELVEQIFGKLDDEARRLYDVRCEPMP